MCIQIGILISNVMNGIQESSQKCEVISLFNLDLMLQHKENMSFFHEQYKCNFIFYVYVYSMYVLKIMRTIPDVRRETKIQIKNIQLFSPSVNYDT